MKTIGLLGGMSWESTVTYYRLINEGIKNRLGGLHSARICLYSVEFEEIEKLQHEGNWAKTAEILSQAAHSVEAAGADFLLICTNTMHKVAPEIESAINIPLIHIADATAEKILAQGVKKVGLLGTRFTMEQDFYRGRLQEKYGIEVLIPDEPGRDLVHRVIYEELCLGKIDPESRKAFVEITNGLADDGAQSVILGCTEVSLLIQQMHTQVPLFDTTEIHALRAVEEALQ
jgi:aspartate racemase